MKPIPGFEKYSATSCGKIINQKGQVLKPFPDQHGYQRLDLYDQGKRKRFYIHVLVMKTFHGARPDLEINHKDKNRKNNSLENLEYCTRIENIEHRSKIDPAIISRIKFLDGKVQAGFWKRLSAALELDQSTIYRIRKGKTWNRH